MQRGAGDGCQSLVLNNVGVSRGANVPAKGVDDGRCVASPPKPLDGGHARVVPAPHVAAVDQLEQLPLPHRDPLDRLLVAQSISESLLLVSADPAFHAYGGPLQDARH